MTDSKTKWHVEQQGSDWVVIDSDRYLIARACNEVTALKIAAVNEMEAALAYQMRVLASFNASNPHSAGMEEVADDGELVVVDVVDVAVKRGMAALAKARGESDG